MNKKNQDNPPTIIGTEEGIISKKKPPNDKIIDFKIVEYNSKKE